MAVAVQNYLQALGGPRPAGQGEARAARGSVPRLRQVAAHSARRAQRVWLDLVSYEPRGVPSVSDALERFAIDVLNAAFRPDTAPGQGHAAGRDVEFANIHLRRRGMLGISASETAAALDEALRLTEEYRGMRRPKKQPQPEHLRLAFEKRKRGGKEEAGMPNASKKTKERQRRGRDAGRGRGQGRTKTTKTTKTTSEREAERPGLPRRAACLCAQYTQVIARLLSLCL